MDFVNRNDNMDVDTSEEDAKGKRLKILEYQDEFKETWAMLDDVTKYIAGDHKQNYSKLKSVFENFTKHAAKIATISGSVHEGLKKLSICK